MAICIIIVAWLSQLDCQHVSMWAQLSRRQSCCKLRRLRAWQVLIEGHSRRSADVLTGKTCTMKRIMIPDVPVPRSHLESQQPHAKADLVRLRPGDYAAVLIQAVGNATLFGRPAARTGIHEFMHVFGSTFSVEDGAALQQHPGIGQVAETEYAHLDDSAVQRQQFAIHAT